MSTTLNTITRSRSKWNNTEGVMTSEEKRAYNKAYRADGYGANGDARYRAKHPDKIKDYMREYMRAYRKRREA